MTRLEIGSPEARAIVAKDKAIQREEAGKLYCARCERMIYVADMACPECHARGQLRGPWAAGEELD